MNKTVTREKYESLLKEEFGIFLVTPVHTNAIERLDINTNDIVLDIGCGQGEFSYLASLRGSKEVHGMDFSESAIIIAKQKFPLLSFEVGNATKITFSNEYFTKIAALGVVGCLSKEDLEKCFSEVSRVLRPGGYFIVRTPQIFDLVGVLVLKLKKLGAYHIISHRYSIKRFRDVARKNGLEIIDSWLSIDNGGKKWGLKKLIFLLLFPFLAQRWILFRKK